MHVTGHTSGKPASIRDVARVAGVSYQTVSRVINGSASVREDTRVRVQHAIEALGFRRSAAAHALASGRPRAVSVLTSNTTLYGYAALLQGVEEAARAAGFPLAISVLEGDVPAAVNHAIDDSGALIVVAWDRLGVLALQSVPDGVPHAAAVEVPSEHTGAGPWCWIDDRSAATMATEYLLSQGHRTVHYVSLPLLSDTSERLEGWRAALVNAGAPVPETVGGDGWDAAAGYRAGRMLAAAANAAADGVTAILAGNDELAIGVLRAMYEAGRAIPGDVSVIGFDDAPQSAYLTPALTTVRQDFTGLGRAHRRPAGRHTRTRPPGEHQCASLTLP